MLTTCSSGALAQPLTEEASGDITDLDMGELLNAEVTGASRYEQSALDVAAPTVVITAEQIQARGYRDLKDVFRDLPGFDVSENVQGEVRTLVILRGVLGNQKLLILQDGQRLNAITGERFVYGNNVPLHHVKRVEVIYGPAAAVYGPDAYAGVVNIITKDGADIRGVEVNLSAGLLGIDQGESWATDDHILFGERFGEDVDLMASFRFYHTPRGADLSDDYPELRPIKLYREGGGGFERAEPVLDYNAYLKLKLGQFTIGARFSDATETNAPSTIPDQYLYTKDFVWRERNSHVFAEHLFSRDILDESSVELRSTVRYQRYEIDPDSNFNVTQTFRESATETNWRGDPIKIPLTALQEYKYALTESIRIEEQSIWRFTDSFILNVGVLVDHVLSFPKTKNLRDGQFDPNHLVVDMSEFADPTTGQIFGVTDDSSWGVRPFTNVGSNVQLDYLYGAILRLVAGVRVDYNTVYGVTYNPRVGAVYRPSTDVTLRAQGGTAYIQPSNYYVWENWANPFAMHIPNTSLEPERLMSFNLGVTWSLLQPLTLSLDLFYNRLTDIIRPVPYTGGVVFNPFQSDLITESFIEINENRGVQQTYGGELKVDYLTSIGHAYASYAYLDGFDEESDFTINKISHHKVLLGADLSFFKGWGVSPRLRWIGPVTMGSSNDLYLHRQAQATASGEDPDAVANTFGPVYGTFLLDLATQYEVIDGLRVYASFRNLLHQKYYTASPYGESIWILPRAPQRRMNFMAGVSYALKL